jgi:glycosyltransferase involved in cell wall biosynthesis
MLFLPDNSERQGEGGLRTRGYFKESKENLPLISIVTIVFNGQKFLEETILSVINQDYSNVEYIIIDAGSTDGTLDIIKKYEFFIDYWVSEKDQGISYGFNKGVSCCTGDLIGLINADDYYEPHALKIIARAFLGNKEYCPKVFFGKTYKLSLNGKKTKKKYFKVGWEVSIPFSHCSAFLSLDYYKKIGLFDGAFKIAMDVDLLMRGYSSGVDFFPLNSFLATQREGGISDKNRIDGYKEYKEVACNYFGFFRSYSGYIFKLIVLLKNRFFK